MLITTERSCLLISLLLLYGLHSYSQPQHTLTYRGSVMDQQGNPLPFASVVSGNMRYGTLTDSTGLFSLSLPAGRYVFSISYLGYRAVEDTIVLNREVQRDYQLEEEVLVLEEVLITDDDRDPAYGIIQLAINHKKENATPFPAYAYEAYTKTAVRFAEEFDKEVLKGIPFGSTDEDEDLPPEVQAELLYLAETMSEVKIRTPDKVNETIKYSKVSGDSEQFSFFGNLMHRFTPYENRIVMENVADRGVVSPLADNSFSYYRFKLLGTKTEKNSTSYKIKVSPKQPHYAAYQGVIYIVDSTYAVKELDFLLTGEQISLLDTLRIRQEYQLVSDAWILFQSRLNFSFAFQLFGRELPFEGYTQSILSDYDIKPQFEKKSFGGEILAISDSALVKDSSFWTLNRPIPLTINEQLDYQFKDSVEQVRQSPEYLDSLSRDSRKLSWGDLISGKTITNYRTNISWRLFSLIDETGFNAIEGYYLSSGLGYSKMWDNEQMLSVEGKVRYGFARERLNYQMKLQWESAKSRGLRISVRGGDYVSEFSRFNQISPLVNTLYSLFVKQSFVRLYRKQFVEANYSQEWFNGFTVRLNARFEDRFPLANRSDYSFFRDDRTYDPNLSIPEHSAFITSIELTYQPFNTYIRTPKGNISLGSDWPVISATYTQGDPQSDGQYADFAQIQLGLSHDIELGVLGQSKWKVQLGTFLRNDNVFLPDVFHYKGNETIFKGEAYDEFFLMPYYTFASDKNYVEAHFEHGFEGFLMSQLPGIRKLKLREYLGFHLLSQENRRAYIELHAGLAGRAFKLIPLRADVHLRLSNNEIGDKWGGTITIPF